MRVNIYSKICPHSITHTNNGISETVFLISDDAILCHLYLYVQREAIQV